MREWLPEDDLVFVVLDAVATLDLGEFRGRYQADGQGRAAFDPEMMVALLLHGYRQGERSSRVIEQRCVRRLPGDHRRAALRSHHHRPVAGPRETRWAGCSARCCGCWPRRAWSRWAR